MLIIITGPSAVGKSHLCDSAVAANFHLITPLTTRKMRDGETQDGEYHFVSRQTFQSLITGGQLNDWDYAFGEYYGAYLSDVQAAVESKEIIFIHALAKIAIRTACRFREGVLTVMLVPSEDKSVLAARLLARGMSDTELRSRIDHNEDEVAHLPLVDFVIQDAEARDSGDVLAEILHQAKCRMKA